MARKDKDDIFSGKNKLKWQKLLQLEYLWTKMYRLTGYIAVAGQISVPCVLQGKS
jgi:hypothetical protein